MFLRPDRLSLRVLKDLADIHKLKYRKLYLNIRNSFTVPVVKHCNSLPREVVEFEYPSLEMFKTGLDMVLGKLL